MQWILKGTEVTVHSLIYILTLRSEHIRELPYALMSSYERWGLGLKPTMQSCRDHQ